MLSPRIANYASMRNNFVVQAVGTVKGKMNERSLSEVRLFFFLCSCRLCTRREPNENVFPQHKIEVFLVVMHVTNLFFFSYTDLPGQIKMVYYLGTTAVATAAGLIKFMLVG